MVHDEIVMVFPGFAGRIQGRDAFIAGFRDFCENATIHHFNEGEHQIDVAAHEAFLEHVKRRTVESFNAVSRASEAGRLGTLPKPRRIDIP